MGNWLIDLGRLFISIFSIPEDFEEEWEIERENEWCIWNYQITTA